MWNQQSLFGYIKYHRLLPRESLLTSISDISLHVKDLFAPEIVASPFGLYGELRPSTPLATADGVWLVMQHAHVFAVLSDHRTFSSDMQHTDNEVLRQTPIIFEDPPGHTRHRKLVQPAFTMARIAALEPWVARVVREVVAAPPVGVEVDAVPALCDPLPVKVIAQLMGVPPERHDDFKSWSDHRTFLVAQRGKPESAEIAARVETAAAANRSLLAYFLDQARRRRAKPMDDLITDLVQANEGNDALTEDEVAAVCALLLTAGNVTTTNLLGNLLALLADRPDIYDRVRANRELVPAVVEEILRLEAPVQWLYRRATREAQVGGATIPAGASLIVYFGAANRDPAVYRDPDLFDLDRDPIRHAAFGHGIHFCLGTPLARLEAELGLSAILDRFSRIERGKSPAKRISDAATHCGHRRLPLVFSA
jgi:cytochrome P450